MQNKQPTTVFVQVDVKDELPTKDGFYFTFTIANREANNWFKDGKWIDEIMNRKPSTVVSWLKPLPASIVLSVEEYEELIGSISQRDKTINALRLKIKILERP